MYIFIYIVGADLVISKPINKTDLVAAIESTLNSKTEEQFINYSELLR